MHSASLKARTHIKGMYREFFDLTSGKGHRRAHGPRPGATFERVALFDPGWSIVLGTLAIFLSLEALLVGILRFIPFTNIGFREKEAHHIEAFKFLNILLGVEPELSEAEKRFGGHKDWHRTIPKR
jgi:hypothetical protein